MREQGPAHGLRGGGLPEHRRVLDAEARDGDDPGRHLHPRLRLLQRQDRQAAARSTRTSRRIWPRPWPSWAWRTSSSPRSTATICRTAGPPVRRAASRRSARARPATTIEILTPDFLRKPGAVEASSRRGPTSTTTISRRCRGSIATVRPGRALLPLAAPAAAGQGARPDACSPSPASWSGLGEEKREVLQVMDDMRSADVDFLTIGQYLQPTPRHHKVERFVEPDEFDGYARSARAKGFLHGLGLAADPQLLPCRRRFRPPARAPGLLARQRRVQRLWVWPMPTHAEKRLLPYRPEQLYELVADVDRYPEFLPWCKAARITRREGDVFYADLVIAFKVFRERFSSQGHLASDSPVIDVEYINGPFRYLNNHWRFDRRTRTGCLRRFLRRLRVQVEAAAEPDRAAVQRGRAPHGGCVRDPRAQALHAGCDDIGPGRATDRQTGHRVGLGRPPVAAALLGGAQTAQRIRCTAPVSPARSAACISTGRATAAIATSHAARRSPISPRPLCPGEPMAPVASNYSGAQAAAKTIVPQRPPSALTWVAASG